MPGHLVSALPRISESWHVVQSSLSQLTPEEQSGLSGGARQASLHSSLATPRGSVDPHHSPRLSPQGSQQAPLGGSFGVHQGGPGTRSPSDLLQRLAVQGPQLSSSPGSSVTPQLSSCSPIPPPPTIDAHISFGLLQALSKGSICWLLA